MDENIFRGIRRFERLRTFVLTCANAYKQGKNEINITSLFHNYHPILISKI